MDESDKQDQNYDLSVLSSKMEDKTNDEKTHFEKKYDEYQFQNKAISNSVQFKLGQNSIKLVDSKSAIKKIGTTIVFKNKIKVPQEIDDQNNPQIADCVSARREDFDEIKTMLKNTGMEVLSRETYKTPLVTRKFFNSGTPTQYKFKRLNQSPDVQTTNFIQNQQDSRYRDFKESKIKEQRLGQSNLYQK